MRTLLVQSCVSANQTVARHFPYYEKAGCDQIIGVLTTGGRCEWPGNNSIEIGRDSYVDGDHLCRRLVDTVQAGIDAGATEIVVIEYDVCFFRALPDRMPSGLVMNATGGWSEGFRGRRYFHPPWMMDLDTAYRVVEAGREMLADGDIEKGFPDRFIGRLAERYDVPVHEAWFQNYTQNSLDQPEYLKQARQARLSGCHMIHGFKSKAQLEYVIAP